MSWPLADEDGEVALEPGDVGADASAGHPGKLVGDAARLIVVAVDGRDDLGGIVGHDDIAEHEPPAGAEDARDAAEEIFFSPITQDPLALAAGSTRPSGRRPEPQARASAST